MPKFIDFYALLHLSIDATPDQINAAFRKEVKKQHPDRNIEQDSTEEMQNILLARETLLDEVSRADYNKEWRAHHPQSAPPKQERKFTPTTKSRPSTLFTDVPSTRLKKDIFNFLTQVRNSFALNYPDMMNYAFAMPVYTPAEFTLGKQCPEHQRKLNLASIWMAFTPEFMRTQSKIFCEKLNPCLQKYDLSIYKVINAQFSQTEHSEFQSSRFVIMYNKTLEEYAQQKSAANISGFSLAIANVAKEHNWDRQLTLYTDLRNKR